MREETDLGCVLHTADSKRIALFRWAREGAGKTTHITKPCLLQVTLAVNWELTMQWGPGEHLLYTTAPPMDIPWLPVTSMKAARLRRTVVVIYGCGRRAHGLTRFCRKAESLLGNDWPEKYVLYNIRKRKISAASSPIRTTPKGAEQTDIKQFGLRETWLQA